MSTNESSRLLRLPRELRDQIVCYVFDDFAQERLDFKRQHNVYERKVTLPIKSLPPICVASQQLYDETTPYFLTLTTSISVNVATTSWLRRWLPTLSSGLGYASIHRLAFHNFHGAEQHKGFELIALCPNLRHLSVMLGDETADAGMVPSLVVSALSSSVNAYESLDNIILMHRLHRLTDIPKLEVLEFGFHDWEEPTSHDRARQVKEWLSVKFLAKGMDVEIVCKQMEWGAASEVRDVDEVLERWYSGRVLEDDPEIEELEDETETMGVFGDME